MTADLAKLFPHEEPQRPDPAHLAMLGSYAYDHVDRILGLRSFHDRKKLNGFRRVPNKTERCFDNRGSAGPRQLASKAKAIFIYDTTNQYSGEKGIGLDISPPHSTRLLINSV